jgi:hypothetical protein
LLEDGILRGHIKREALLKRVIEALGEGGREGDDGDDDGWMGRKE